MSEASINFRKGLATIFAAFREVAVDSYYGEAGSVIEYPISMVAWASPLPTDQGYQVAFSKDINGNDIYRDGMTSDQRHDSAIAAAIEYIKAAGFTFDEASGKFTAAPEGAKLYYEFGLTAEGGTDHPAYQYFFMCQAAFEDLGFDISLYNPSNFMDVFAKYQSGQGELGFGAWGGGYPDPDIAFNQFFHSLTIPTEGRTGQNTFGVDHPRIDQIAAEGRYMTDQTARKALYKEGYDIILDMAVIVPFYQRMNCTAASTQRVDVSTLEPDITPFWGALDIVVVKMR